MKISTHFSYGIYLKNLVKHYPSSSSRLKITKKLCSYSILKRNFRRLIFKIRRSYGPMISRQVFLTRKGSAEGVIARDDV